MELLANAKINISLKIVGKRDNGYHDLDMVVSPIAIYDKIYIDIIDEEEDIVEFDDFSIPVEKNSVTKALNVLRNKYGFKEHFDIYIEKGIPSFAGLGGGSSDAAFVMKAVNKLLKLNITNEELIKIGALVGADVPFFILNSNARVEGIGEIVNCFNLETKLYVLLVKPFLGCSTKEMYERYDQLKSEKEINTLEIIKALKEGNLLALNTLRVNDLEIPAIEQLNDISRIIDKLNNDGFECVGMTGSGSTVFALSKNEELIKQKAEYYHKKGYYTVSTYII